MLLFLDEFLLSSTEFYRYEILSGAIFF